jgi:hypothetical protein
MYSRMVGTGYLPHKLLRLTLTRYRSLQLVLCGIATDRAREVLLRKKTSMRYIGAIPLARPMLACAMLFNALVGVMCYYDIMAWMTEQDRSHDSISSFKWPDILTPVFAALVAATVQSFMAYRCWRIVNNSICFAILAGSGISLALAGAAWTLVESRESVLFRMLSIYAYTMPMQSTLRATAILPLSFCLHRLCSGRALLLMSSSQSHSRCI